MALSNETIQELNDFQANLEAEYKFCLTNPEDLAEFEEIIKIRSFDGELETPNEIFGWHFEGEQEIEVRKILIAHFEQIKHELTGIPVKLKFFAFDATRESFHDYLDVYGFDSMDSESLTQCLRSAALAVEAVFRFAAHNDTFYESINDARENYSKWLIEQTAETA